MNAVMARITINRYYEQLQKATTTSERRRCLNSAIVLLNNFPSLGKFFIRRDDYHFIVGRLVRVEDFEDFDLSSVPRFDDGIDRETEKAFRNVEGLYFLGEITLSEDGNEVLYWVKIGFSSNLRGRMRNYDTHCPSVRRFDFCGDGELEDYYHKLLGVCCLDRASSNDEWFRVDKKTYFKMQKQGFSYFD